MCGSRARLSRDFPPLSAMKSLFAGKGNQPGLSTKKKDCLKLLDSDCCFKSYASVTEGKNCSHSSLVTDLVLTLFHVLFSFLNRLVTHVAVTLLVEWHQLYYHMIIHNAANKSLKMFVGE